MARPCFLTCHLLFLLLLIINLFSNVNISVSSLTPSWFANFIEPYNNSSKLEYGLLFVSVLYILFESTKNWTMLPWLSI